MPIDAYPAYQFDADPDSTYHSDADSDPTFNLKRILAGSATLDRLTLIIRPAT
jgi:hypothetical protein